MTGWTPTKKLKRHLGELEDETEMAAQWIRSYHSDGIDPPRGRSALGKAPSQYLIEDAARVIEFALMMRGADRREYGELSSRLEYILYGVATELLITGIHLDVAREQFLSTVEDTGQTPSFDDSKQIVLTDVQDVLTDQQVAIVMLTLDIIRGHRNNLVHFGLHQTIHAYDEPAIFDVLGWLLDHYSDTELDVVELMDEVRNELRSNTTGRRLRDMGFEIG